MKNMQSHEIIIIGGGLFGSIIGSSLKREGHEVVIIDDNNPKAGSKPAACLMKSGWFSSLGKDVYEPSLKLLDKLYGIHDIPFVVYPTKKTVNVHWVDPELVLKKHEIPIIPHTVSSIEQDELGFIVRFENKYPLYCSYLVIAAGIWTEHFVKLSENLQGQSGVAFLYEKTFALPSIKVWAPYKQLVKFNRGDGAWVGDGSAIKPKNWTAERELQSFERCAEFMNAPYQPVKKLYGIRPYSKMKPCYFEQRGNKFIATGGAKNGTVAAGWVAHQICERLR